MLQHWWLRYETSTLIRCLIWCLPGLLSALDEVTRTDTVGRLRWSKIGVLGLRRGVLLAEQTEGPVRDVEAAEDDDGEEDLLLRGWVSESAWFEGLKQAEKIENAESLKGARCLQHG